MKALFLSIVGFIFITSSSFAQKNFESELDRVTDSVLANTKIPGMIVSYTCGDYSWEKAKGFSNIADKTLMKLDNTYRIGSVTKTFTISVLLQLVDEARLSLDDKISKFFPDFPDAENITVRMLADMRSGIYNYSERAAFEDTLTNRPTKVWSNQQLVDFALEEKPYFPPNTDFHYSNTNTIMIGMIIEKLTGSTLRQEVNKRIINPLGLKNTYMAEGTEIKGDYSHGYMIDDKDTINKPLMDVTTLYDVSWAGAAGDIVSDLRDVKIYLKALGKGNFYSKELQTQRLDWATTKGFLKYGLGIFTIGGGFIGHNGGIPGFTNISLYNPEKDCTIIVMYNIQSDILPDKLAMRILELTGDL